MSHGRRSLGTVTSTAKLILACTVLLCATLLAVTVLLRPAADGPDCHAAPSLSDPRILGRSCD